LAAPIGSDAAGLVRGALQMPETRDDTKPQRRLLGGNLDRKKPLDRKKLAIKNRLRR
jgi:hypothetical protein